MKHLGMFCSTRSNFRRQNRFEEDFKATAVQWLTGQKCPPSKHRTKKAKIIAKTKTFKIDKRLRKHPNSSMILLASLSGQSFKTIFCRFTSLSSAIYSWFLISLDSLGKNYSNIQISSGQSFKAIFCRFTSLSSAIYVVPVVIFTLIWNIPHFTELNTCYKVRWLKDYERCNILYSLQYSSIYSQSSI